MSKYEDANLILKLYDLRREEVMRKGRNWFATEFNPQTVEDFEKAMMGEHSGHLRMVLSYWDMACAFVLNGAIDEKFFNDTNGEHIFVFAKLQPILAAVREKMGAPMMGQNIEKVVMNSPNVEANLERIRGVMRMMAARRAEAADQSLRV